MRPLIPALLLLSSVASAQEAPEPPVVEAAVEEDAAAPYATFIWQGFDHIWLRTVAGGWAVPHRVSRFRTGFSDDVHQQGPDGVVSSAHWEFAQSTGVDGDFMSPEGYYSRVVAPDVRMLSGKVGFSTEDRAMDPSSPRVLARFHEQLRFPALADDDVAVALVRGLGFASKCLDGPEACNSNGIWPYRFRVELAPCERVSDEWVCPVEVEVGRAWTPTKGGVPGVGIKQAAERMSIEVELDWLVMTGSDSSLKATHVWFENALASTHRIEKGEQPIPVPVAGGGAYPEATVGWSAFSFEFVPTKKRSSMERRGRYLAGWSMRARESDYDAEAGVFTVGHSGGVWLTRSVVKTGVRLELGLAIVQFGHPDARVTEGEPVVGELCTDSHGAPAFSRWKKCESLSRSEKLEDRVRIEMK